MDTKAWKCYRCNLVFREELHAILHKEISNHSLSKDYYLVPGAEPVPSAVQRRGGCGDRRKLAQHRFQLEKQGLKGIVRHG